MLFIKLYSSIVYLFAKLLDGFLSFLQHKGKFEEAIKVGEYFEKHISKLSDAYLLIASRIAFLYNYKEKSTAFYKITKLALRFQKDYTDDITGEYNKRTLSLIAKIFDMYGISLQSFWKDYNEAIKAHREALKIAKKIDDKERICHITLHLVAAYRDGNIPIKEKDAQDMLTSVFSSSKDKRVKFCACFETIEWYISKGKLDLAKNKIIETEAFLQTGLFLRKGRYKKFYPNEAKTYDRLKISINGGPYEIPRGF